MPIRSWKFRLYPTKTQQKDIVSHLWICKELWNEMLAFTKEIYKNYKKFPTKRALREIVKNSGLHSQVAQELVDRLVDALHKKIDRKRKGMVGGFPRFKNIDRMKSLVYPQSGFKLKDSRNILVSPFGGINIKKHREMNGNIKTLTIKRESSGRWFAIFTTEIDAIQMPLKEVKPIGVDLGLMTFATLSNGEQIKKPKHLKAYEDKLAFRQRELSNKKLRSRNRRKARVRVARIYSKIADCRKYWLHKIANDLLSRYSLIALEDLKVQEIAEEHGKGVGDAGWGIFTNILSYKAESAGCDVVFVNPKNTSKDCSRCGNCVPKELWERQHDCPSCGLSIDRDINAAINILNRATVGTTGSNACGDVSLETSMKQDATGFSPW
jgi:putative transposase